MPAPELPPKEREVPLPNEFGMQHGEGRSGGSALLHAGRELAGRRSARDEAEGGAACSARFAGGPALRPCPARNRTS